MPGSCTQSCPPLEGLADRGQRWRQDQTLITLMIDFQRFAAAPLAQLYRQRWEIGPGFQETKQPLQQSQDCCAANRPNWSGGSLGHLDCPPASASMQRAMPLWGRSTWCIWRASVAACVPAAAVGASPLLRAPAALRRAFFSARGQALSQQVPHEENSSQRLTEWHWPVGVSQKSSDGGGFASSDDRAINPHSPRVGTGVGVTTTGMAATAMLKLCLTLCAAALALADGGRIVLILDHDTEGAGLSLGRCASDGSGYRIQPS